MKFFFFFSFDSFFHHTQFGMQSAQNIIFELKHGHDFQFNQFGDGCHVVARLIDDHNRRNNNGRDLSSFSNNLVSFLYQI